MREDKVSDDSVASPFKTFKIVDANYKVVRETLGRVLLDYPDFCGCEKCRCKVIATALNYLSPHYYVEGDGKGSERVPDFASTAGLVENAIRIGIAEASLFDQDHP